MPLTSLRCRRVASWPPSSDETWVLSPRCCSTPPPIRCFWETTPISIPSTNISVPPIRSSGPILIVIKNMKLHLQLFEEGVSNSPQFLSFFLSGCLLLFEALFLGSSDFILPSSITGASSWQRVTFPHLRISSMWISTLTWSPSPNLSSTSPLERLSTLTRWVWTSSCLLFLSQIAPAACCSVKYVCLLQYD